MRRSIALWALLVFAAASCEGDGAPSPTATSPTATSPPATAGPFGLPQGTPPSFDEDLAASDLPLDELVPEGARPVARWEADPAIGESVLVSYERGDDPFAQERGLLVWVRDPSGEPPWRPFFGFSSRPSERVVGIGVQIGDGTGDGSVDALAFARTLSSGACGTWRLVDLVGAAVVWTRRTCDTDVSIDERQGGLVVAGAVFRAGDAHCCPSAIRTTLLTFEGTEWRRAWTEVSRITA